MIIKFNGILSSTSQSDHVFTDGNVNINLLNLLAIENDFINNCHSNSLIPRISKPTRNAINNSSILDHIWSIRLYVTFNGIFLVDITDLYPIFAIVQFVPLNCPERRIRVKFEDNSGPNLARLELLIQMISVVTYLLSIAIVVLPKKNKY